MFARDLLVEGFNFFWEFSPQIKISCNGIFLVNCFLPKQKGSKVYKSISFLLLPQIATSKFDKLMIFHFLGFKMKFIKPLLIRCIVILLPILSLRNAVSSTTFLVLINLLCDGESEAKIPKIF